MKKTMFAVVCMAMMAMGCMAKDNNHKVQKNHGNAPRHEMVDHVINMKIVKEMGLPEKKVNEIAALQTKRFEEVKNLRAEQKKQHGMAKPQANAKPQHGEKHMGKKGQHFAEHKAKMNAINEKYRKDVKHIMGTDTYVKYVEKVNDQLAMNHMGKHHQKGHNRHAHHGKKMHKHGIQMHHQHHDKPMHSEAA